MIKLKSLESQNEDEEEEEEEEVMIITGKSNELNQSVNNKDENIILNQAIETEQIENNQVKYINFVKFIYINLFVRLHQIVQIWLKLKKE